MTEWLPVFAIGFALAMLWNISKRLDEACGLLRSILDYLKDRDRP